MNVESKQQREVKALMALAVTNLEIMFVPYPPNSEMSLNIVMLSRKWTMYFERFTR